eukprot:282176_1
MKPVSSPFSRTENILCENQNISIKISVLDELARELHIIDHIIVESNDSSIIFVPNNQIKISNEKNGGPMYATIQLYAAQNGYATIMLREVLSSSIGSEIRSQTQSSSQSSSSSSSKYIHESPDFLRTFLQIHVLS